MFDDRFVAPNFTIKGDVVRGVADQVQRIARVTPPLYPSVMASIQEMAERYLPAIVEHRGAFAPADQRGAFSQGDVIYCGPPGDLPEWCTVLYVHHWEHRDAAVPLSRDLRLGCPALWGGAGKNSPSEGPGEVAREILRRMAEGWQVFLLPPGGEGSGATTALLRDVVARTDPATAVVHPPGDPAGLPEGELWCEPRVYSCHADHLRALTEALDPEGTGNPRGPLAVLGVPGAPDDLPEIAGIDPVLPEEQQQWMRHAAVCARLALPGVPVIHSREVCAEEILRWTVARDRCDAFHPRSPATVLEGPPGLLAVRRDGIGGGAPGETVLCLHNLSGEYREYRHRKDRFPWRESGVLRDLVNGDLVVPVSEGSLFSLELEPWEALWVTFSADIPDGSEAD